MVEYDSFLATMCMMMGMLVSKNLARYFNRFTKKSTDVVSLVVYIFTTVSIIHIFVAWSNYNPYLMLCYWMLYLGLNFTGISKLVAAFEDHLPRRIYPMIAAGFAIIIGGYLPVGISMAGLIYSMRDFRQYYTLNISDYNNWKQETSPYIGNLQVMYALYTMSLEFIFITKWKITSQLK